MTNSRIERDSLGEIEIPAGALYGPQTQRAINNFPVSGQTLPPTFIHSLLIAKLAAARANARLSQLNEEISAAICDAIDQLLQDDALMTHFPVDLYQTGSGTSTNMNANEVIAHLASNRSSLTIDPNDHVNCSQSSNDIIPSTLHISAATEIEISLIPALNYLASVTRNKAKSLEFCIKTGRTHLMDAMPISMGQALSAWAEQIEMNAIHLRRFLPSLQMLAQGGTAVGTGVNAHPEFATEFNKEVSALTGIHFKRPTNFFAYIGSQDTAVALSGHLKTVAVSIMKISNDLRWMNSGPLSGLGEINLEPLQPGSSIMPGKVNPVVPESAAMVAAQVIGYDASTTLAGQSGNFELNVMLPLIANNLLESIRLLTNTSYLLADRAIASFTVNTDRLAENLARNPILVTALNPIIGYQKAAEIAKQAYAEKRSIIEVAHECTGIALDELQRILDPQQLIRPR